MEKIDYVFIIYRIEVIVLICQRDPAKDRL